MKLGKILYWLLVIFVIYIIIEIIKKIFGGSIGFEEAVIALLVANLGYSFYLTRHVSEINLKISKNINNIDSKLSEHLGWHKGKENSK